MNELGRKIRIGKKRHTLTFTTLAYSDVLDRYGSIEAMGEKIENMSEAESIKELAWLIALLCNSTIKIREYEDSKKYKKITTEEVLLAMRPMEVLAAYEQIVAAINDGLRVTEDEDEEVDEVLEEIKN